MLKINNPVVENLQAARNLIADPEKWCQGAAYMGAWTDISYCAIGAVYSRTHFKTKEALLAALEALDEAAVEMLPSNVDPKSNDLCPAAWVNDNLGHTAVLRMFDRAIELALNDPHP